ncbi:YitT family protein [Lacticaseibacillus absianus]|uniref:YitT family protein n=1 Tax=Lacticaseibacillus absianus TaxID=2729623 RepID=UPI0015C8285A|nr:YitT family protein [Lacticaseibacillus absianus]
MLQVDKRIREQPDLAAVGAAIIYNFSSAIALNMFLLPGGVYTSGITGASQLIARLSQQFDKSILLSTGNINLLLNLPLFWLAWHFVGHRFTLYTMLSVILSSLAIDLFQLPALTHDPLLCGVFGALIWGFGTGVALRTNISTGGLDVIELLLHRSTKLSVGTINTIFNGGLLLIAGACYGWQGALVSALSIIVSARVIDAQYTQQHRLQALIITQRPTAITHTLHRDSAHGITLLHNAQGGYSNQRETVLITVISSAEADMLISIVRQVDPAAFISISPVIRVDGQFAESSIR